MGGRGRAHGGKEREMILSIVDEAVQAGARLRVVCRELDLSVRTIERWRVQSGGEDGRKGPLTAPANKLSTAERGQVLETVNSPEFHSLSPNQIVPILADKQIYMASESTVYRILREEDQLKHRGRARPATRKRPTEYIATGSCQVWSWDITYLKSEIRGKYYYLYMIEDVWSRKIVGWEVYENELDDLAAQLFCETCADLDLDPTGLVLHSDNGNPMKGSTMLATLQRLGVVTSFSRPHVSDDNPYSESLFRTLKYRPEYPSEAFSSLEEARIWVTRFVDWYNTEHLHSGISFVTPDNRHYGEDKDILAGRHSVYQDARKRNPSRWSGQTRNWGQVKTVVLNLKKRKAESTPKEKAA